jgi:Ca2+/Na+ antiporter
MKMIKIINTVLPVILIIAFLTGLFIPEIRSLENYILFSLISVFIFSLLLYLNQKNLQFITRFLFLILILVVLRFNYSFIYLKRYQKDIVSYKKYALDLLQITDNQPIHFTGIISPFYLNRLETGSCKFIYSHLEKIYYPPELPFQIPFYITRHTGKIMRYDSCLYDSQYYLGYINHIDTSEIDILHYYNTVGTNKNPGDINIDKPYSYKKGLILFKKRE